MANKQMDEIYENIPVLVEARAYYSSQIKTMEQEVYKLTGSDSPIRNDIQAEFEELDKVFDELKADLNDNAANQEVVEAMIQNYRLKLQILEEILYQLNNAGKNNDKDEEKRTVL
jgi:chromosome segregation ATPase